ncbi:MAG: winged helix-turn-helix domain-containing protein, partial [Bacteroidaceae bacterium]
MTGIIKNVDGTDNAVTIIICEDKKYRAIMQIVVGTDPLKHEIVYNQLVSIIIKNKYQVGEQLPTERVLAEKIGVNMSTLRRAFKELTDSGIV